MLKLNKGYNAKTDLLKVVMHDIQSPLRFIGTIMQDLVLNCTNMDKEKLKEHITMVHKSVASLQHYCNTIYSQKKDNTAILETNPPTSINEIFDDIKKVYAPLIEFKKIRFNVIKTDLYCFINKEILFTIIINLIDNAYKNTNKGEIALAAFFENDVISVVVSDTGKGIGQKKISDILKSKLEIVQATRSSLGYSIINDLLKKINGGLAIKSNRNIGTKVFINLLNPEKHDSVCLGS